MNTLKSLVVIGVLAFIGYGLYVHMNNAPPSATPDYIKKQTLPEMAPATVEMGREANPAGDAAPVSVATYPQPGAPSAPPPTTSAPSPPPLISDPTAAGASPAAGAPPSAGMAQPYAVSGAGTATGRDAYPATIAAAGPAVVYPAAGAARPYTADAAMPSTGAMPSAGATPATVPMPTDVVPAGAVQVGDTAAAGPPDRNAPTRGEATPVGADAIPAAPSPPAAAPPIGAIPPLRNQTPTGSVAAVDPATSAGSPDYDGMMATAQNQLDGGRWETALLTLTQLYEDPRLNRRQQEPLENLLDRICGTVIYSKKYLFEPAHRVGAGERLEDVAKKYNVPAELIAKINGLKVNQPLERGQELKVLQGPFQAVVNPQRRTLMLKVGGRYAGRFPVGIGPELTETTGQFVVSTKIRQNFKFDGQRYMELVPTTGVSSTTKLAIVGVADPGNAGRGQAPGTIAVNPRNADDVYDILSQGSPVTIRR